MSIKAGSAAGHYSLSKDMENSSMRLMHQKTLPKRVHLVGQFDAGKFALRRSRWRSSKYGQDVWANSLKIKQKFSGKAKKEAQENADATSRIPSLALLCRFLPWAVAYLHFMGERMIGSMIYALFHFSAPTISSII